MEKFDIEKLRSLPIEGVASRLGLTVNKHKSLCPFHEDSHPSLTFNVAKNTFRCYVCNAHGGVIDLAMHVLNKNFVEACKWLADTNNILLSEWQPVHKPSTINHKPSLDIEWLSGLVCRPTLNEEASKFLFEERKIDPRVVRWLGISSISTPMPCWRYGRAYFDAPSLLIPYRDVNGNLLSVQSRYLGAAKETPRFRFPRGSKCHIYNLPVLKMLKPGEPLYITEGVTDCMAMLSAGHKAIAIPSATLLSADDKKLLKSFAEGLHKPSARLEETLARARTINHKPSTTNSHKPSTINSHKPSTINHKPLSLHMYPDADVPGEKLYFQLVSLANEIGASLQRHSLPIGFKDFGAYWAAQQS